MCGTGKAMITPPADLLPNLYGLMGSRYAGVIDNLYVRVMMLANDEGEKCLFVSWDLDKAPNPELIVPELAKKTGTAEDNILYFGVHTHCAPCHSARIYDGPNAKHLQTPERIEATNAYEHFIYIKLMEAVELTVDSMRPARIGRGLGKSYIGVNRIQDYFIEKEGEPLLRCTALGSNPEGKADPTLFVMRVEDYSGQPLGFLVNHAVHCCVMIMNNFDSERGVGISADIAGQVSTLLEERYPGAVALWSSGAAGDINPIMMNQYNYADPVTGEPAESRDYSSAEPAKLMLLQLSRRQFADVLRVNREIICDIEEAEISGATETVNADMPGSSSNPYQIRLRGVRIGSLAMCGVSGELFNSLGKEIQARSGFDHTIIINHECCLQINSGYIFDDETLEKCLQADGSLLGGLPGLRDNPLRPGYLLPELKKSAAKLFDRL